MPAVPADDPPKPKVWRKSTHSTLSNCVEASPETGGIALRDSKDPQGPVLHFTRSEWDAFALGMKAGEFDDL